jgi:hypothetical protein
MPAIRPPFQGDSLGDVYPGLKPMGCSVFALWAMQNVQTHSQLIYGDVTIICETVH